ncbi:hypothetical protein QVD17_31788 [Tagetes erecta]|uniref:Uncharacterized protein n=1 Tax=Tagetes erecta TaxID=13708 RepID=A0AAD8K424_TARER|nr:hypothetical protein QVD17_31788 [Tagetes erecta]
MATHHLLMLSRRFHRAVAATRSISTVASVSDTPAPAPPHPELINNDSAASRLKLKLLQVESDAVRVKSKLKRIENLDPRFLKYNSPYPTLTDHMPILAYPETRVTTLPNGLRVATESNLASHTATVCVSVDTGSRFETKETNGVAHYLEHMVFQGTLKRSRSEIMEEFENMGAKLDANTSREQTVYTAEVMAGDWNKAVEILADMLQNSTFDQKLISDVRHTIMDKLVELNEWEVLFDRMHAAAFQHSSLGWTVLGPAKNIMDMTKKAIQDYHSTHYTAHRMVISASGAVKHEDIVEQVNKMFTKLPTNLITSKQLVESEPAIFTGSEIRERDDDKPYAYFGILFNGPSSTDPDKVALLVMQTMLGYSDTTTKHTGSQLAQMAGIDELAEYVVAESFNYKETRLFGVYGGAKPDRLDDLASAIMQEIGKLCYQVEENDVVRAQNQLKYLLFKEHHCTEEIGRQLLEYGRRIPLGETFARIDAVDVATIKRVANKYIFDQDISIVAFGPVKLLPDLSWFRNHTSMFHN